ncbi:MAG: FkbM family methyltransferase [Coleofasciculaceae cyanobacterium]
MKEIFLKFYNRLLQTIIRFLCGITGKGGGKFAKLLAPGQTYLINNYCGNLNLQIDTSYPMEASIWLAGVYEVITTKFLQEVIHEGDVFLDVGANCGALTLVAANLIGKGKVYAFEPSPNVRERLQGNINLNPHLKDTIAIIPKGLGLNKQQVFYNEDPNYLGNGSLYENQGIPVEILALDQWVAQEKLEKIDLIKIDVEGMEYDVLVGGKTVLETYQPIIYFETLPIFYETTLHNIKTIYEFLEGLGYTIVQPKKPHLKIPFSGPYPANSVAIPASKANRLLK